MDHIEGMHQLESLNKSVFMRRWYFAYYYGIGNEQMLRCRSTSPAVFSGDQSIHSLGS